MNIKELASLMGQSETDTEAFVKCVSYWMSKGLSYEDAIAKHMSVMEIVANNCMRSIKPLKELAVSMYDELRAAANGDRLPVAPASE